MAILRRVLYLDALLNAVSGLLLTAAPRFAVVTLLGQREPADDAWIRLLGVSSFVLALFMVLIAHRIEDVWWWSWAFVVLEGAGALILTFHALVGVPPGTAVWPWWAMAALTWGFGIALLWGLARAGLERPPI